MSMARLPNTREEARLYLDRLPEYNRDKSSSGALCLHATSAFMKFPFFHTAAALYGALTEQDEEELWAIGQMRIALLRHVVAGGIHRFEASKWLAKGAFQELEAFRVKWHTFNEKMYMNRKSHTPEPPIVSLWRSALDADSNITEVKGWRTPLSSRTLTSVTGDSDLGRNALRQSRRNDTCAHLDYNLIGGQRRSAS